MDGHNMTNTLHQARGRTCVACGADMVGSDRCGFCHCLSPEKQGPALYASAAEFLRQAAKHPVTHVGPRSKFRALARALCDMRCLRLVNYNTKTGATYTLTPYGAEVDKHTAKPD
jgi:hypothetical protein